MHDRGLGPRSRQLKGGTEEESRHEIVTVADRDISPEALGDGRITARSALAVVDFDGPYREGGGDVVTPSERFATGDVVRPVENDEQFADVSGSDHLTESNRDTPQGWSQQEPSAWAVTTTDSSTLMALQ